MTRSTIWVYALGALVVGLAMGSAITCVAGPLLPVTGVTSTITETVTGPATITATMEPTRKVSRIPLVFVSTADAVNMPTYPLEYRVPHIMKEWGYDATLTYLGSRAGMDAFVAGKCDFYAGFGSVLPAIVEGGDFVLVTGGAHLDYVLVAKEDIKSTKDLEGRTVGASSMVAESAQDLVYMMKADGADPSKVKWSMVGAASARRGALATGTIDAALLTMDYAYDLVGEVKGVHILAAFSDYTSPPLNSWWTTRKFVKEHPDIVQDVARASVKALLQPYLDKDGFIDDVMSAIEAEGAVKGRTREYYEKMYSIYIKDRVWAPTWDRGRLELTMDLFIQSGTLSQPIPIEQWADMTFTEEAVKEMDAPWTP